MRELSLGSVEPNVTCGVDKVLCISLQENVNSLKVCDTLQGWETEMWLDDAAL